MAAGLIGHALALAPADLTHRLGVPVTTPARTWCDLASQLDFGELVAAGDRILFHRDPLAARADLERAVATFAGRRGIRSLRLALPALSDRAESVKETQTRLLVVGAGLPLPAVNHEVTDGTGRFVARVDLAYPELRIAIEYEGDQHRTDRVQWRRDISRIRTLTDLGWHVIRLTDDDLQHPAGLLNELRARVPPR